jgi:hypothetical protein
MRGRKIGSVRNWYYTLKQKGIEQVGAKQGFGVFKRICDWTSS